MEATWNIDGEGPIISSPRVVALGSKSKRLLELSKCHIKFEVHMSVCFVEMIASFHYNEGVGDTQPGFVFELPTRHSATVTSVVVSLPGDKCFETVVVESSPSLEMFRNREGKGMRTAMNRYQQAVGRDIDQFDSGLFSLPFFGLKKGETVEIHLHMIDNLNFELGEFVFDFPLVFPEQMIPKKELNEIMSLECSINTGTTKSMWRSTSHPMVTIQSSEGSVAKKNDVNSVMLKFDESKPWSNDSFRISYQCWEDRIICRALFEKGTEGVQNSTMSLFLTPPGPEKVKTHFNKHVTFILDRSGSMGFTDVMEDAKQALIAGLQQLKPGDKFAICAFDHRQFWFAGSKPIDLSAAEGDPTSMNTSSKNPASGDSQGSHPHLDATNPTVSPEAQEMEKRAVSQYDASKFLLPVNNMTIRKAIDWVNSVTPGGLTDIIQPLKQAIHGLDVHPSSSTDDTKMLNRPGSVPIVFLITDGAVENEPEICRFAQSVANSARLFTFGIGEECNSYFLRKLSTIGRGYTDISLKQYSLVNQMTNLFNHAHLPVLTDIVAQFDDDVLGKKAEWFPPRFPDLYCGSPIIASCSFGSADEPPVVPSGSRKLTVQGKLPPSLDEPTKTAKESKDTGTLANNNNGGDDDAATAVVAEPINAVTESHVAVEVDEFFVEELELIPTNAIPLGKVFAQQKLENLITNTWFADVNSPEGEQKRKECVDLAIKHSLPCVFTQMVARETTKQEMQEEAQDPTKKRDMRRFRGSIVFLGAAVVGAAAFGSVAATLAGGTASGLATGVDGECCALCEDCDCADCLDGCDGCL